MKSLYTKPQYVEKNPIIKNRYLYGRIPFKKVLLIALYLRFNMIPNRKRMSPCAISPNITPNKNGKVTVVKKEGLAS